MAWIQDSNFKKVGFRIQIWAYRALFVHSPIEMSPRKMISSNYQTPAYREIQKGTAWGGTVGNNK